MYVHYLLSSFLSIYGMNSHVFYAYQHTLNDKFLNVILLPFPFVSHHFRYTICLTNSLDCLTNSLDCLDWIAYLLGRISLFRFLNCALFKQGSVNGLQSFLDEDWNYFFFFFFFERGDHIYNIFARPPHCAMVRLIMGEVHRLKNMTPPFILWLDIKLTSILDI